MNGGRSGARGLVAGCLLAALAGCTVVGGLPAQGTARAPTQDTLEARAQEIEQAEALYQGGRWADAQRAYERLSAQYPRNAHVWLRLGNSLARQSRYEDAAVALQNAVLVEGTNGAASFNLGLVRLVQAQAAFDYARTRLAGQPMTRQQAESLKARVDALLADLESTPAKDARRAGGALAGAWPQP